MRPSPRSKISFSFPARSRWTGPPTLPSRLFRPPHSRDWPLLTEEASSTIFSSSGTPHEEADTTFDLDVGALVEVTLDTPDTDQPSFDIQANGKIVIPGELMVTSTGDDPVLSVSGASADSQIEVEGDVRFEGELNFTFNGEPRDYEADNSRKDRLDEAGKPSPVLKAKPLRPRRSPRQHQSRNPSMPSPLRNQSTRPGARSFPNSLCECPRARLLIRHRHLNRSAPRHSPVSSLHGDLLNRRPRRRHTIEKIGREHLDRYEVRRWNTGRIEHDRT